MHELPRSNLLAACRRPWLNFLSNEPLGKLPTNDTRHRCMRIASIPWWGEQPQIIQIEMLL